MLVMRSLENRLKPSILFITLISVLFIQLYGNKAAPVILNSNALLF